ncbi:MAG: hypothetical protein KC591_16770 [Gemmatimonadetes bacterium]|nr:hypothetical protein [Gemmatimonadota bacterium]
MADLEKVLDKYDLRDLESAIRKRRVKEEKNLATLVQRKRELESELRKVERAYRGALAAAQAHDGKRRRKPNARRLNDISLAEAMVQVMKARRKPIHYRDLMEAIQKRKLYQTNSPNLLSTIAVTLKRDKRFKKAEPGYYTLA